MDQNILIIENEAETQKVEKPKKTFKLEGKSFFCTFPQSNGEITKEQVMDKIIKLMEIKGRKIQGIVVGEEPHEVEGRHFHCAWKIDKKINMGKALCLDEITGKHGNYQTARQWTDVVVYCAKQEDYCFRDLDVQAIRKSKTSKRGISFETAANKIINGSRVPELIKECPGFLMQNKKKIEDFINLVDKLADDVPLAEWTKAFTESTDWSSGRLVEWLNLNCGPKTVRPFKQKQLWLCGEANIGKTTLVEQLSKYHKVYYCPYDGDWYDNFDKTYDLVVLDEFRGQKSLQWLNKFLEGSPMPLNRRSTNTYTKLRNIPVIILSNSTPEKCFHKKAISDPSGFVAFTKRLELLEFTGEELVRVQYRDLSCTEVLNLPASPLQSNPLLLVPQLMRQDAVFHPLMEDFSSDEKDDMIDLGSEESEESEYTYMERMKKRVNKHERNLKNLKKRKYSKK